MSFAGTNSAAGQDVELIELGKFRTVSQGDDPAVLADLYQDIINMAVWQRQLPADVEAAVDAVLDLPHGSEFALSVSPADAEAAVGQALGGVAAAALCKDIAFLVDMFCALLGFERAGLRLTVLKRAMCPRFHVDNVPCRFATTYHGVGTEWLPHHVVDRSKLGQGSKGLSDLESGLYGGAGDIEQLQRGDVALLKGELWEGNENAGLVHRSPAVSPGESRLLLTLDIVSH